MTNAILSDVELLRRLVGFDSTSRNSNLPIADFICDYLDRPGVRVTRHPSPDGEKTNLVVLVGPEPDADRAGLMLSGHMDVVPAEEPEWRSDPFELTETDTAWVGRGACDMKGFVALAINTAARAAAARAATAELRSPLALVLTYDEEVGTLGAHHFARTWPAERPLPRAAVIGEPTSLEVVRLHKGHCKLHLELTGKSAHSGYPHLGQSAIEPAGRAIVALARLRRALESESCPHGEHFPEVPFVALNVARIEGGSAVNIIPDRCRIDLGFRVLPGMEAGQIAEQVETALAEALPEGGYVLEHGGESPPLATSEEAGIYRDACALVDQTATVSASYATDAGWFQTAGFECVLFGPGTIAVAHRPNESIPKHELARGAELLARLVESRCAAGA